MVKPVKKKGRPSNHQNHQYPRQQLAQAAGAVPTNQWGGTSGCVALVLAKAAFRETTGDTNEVVDS